MRPPSAASGQLNVVVTILVDLTDDLRIKSFGGFRGGQLALQTFDNAMRDELKEKLRRGFRADGEARHGHYILPHIDAGGKVQQWRNWVDFDRSNRTRLLLRRT